MNNIFVKLKELEMNAHKWHLETTSYPKHKTFQKLYEFLVDATDTLMEELQGKLNKRLSVTGNMSTISFYPIEKHLDIIKNVESLLLIESTLYGKDIENNIIGIMEYLHQTKYLLTLQ